MSPPSRNHARFTLLLLEYSWGGGFPPCLFYAKDFQHRAPQLHPSGWQKQIQTHDYLTATFLGSILFFSQSQLIGCCEMAHAQPSPGAEQPSHCVGWDKWEKRVWNHFRWRLLCSKCWGRFLSLALSLENRKHDETKSSFSEVMKSAISSLQYIKWTQAGMWAWGWDHTSANTGHKILAFSARLPAAWLGGVASAVLIASLSLCHTRSTGVGSQASS